MIVGLILAAAATISVALEADGAALGLASLAGAAFYFVQ